MTFNKPGRCASHADPTVIFPMFTVKYYTCRSCHENSRIRTYATDRVDLEREVGERFSSHCQHCGKAGSIHVNDVKAAPNRTVTGIGIAAGVVATVALWQVGFIALASGALPVIVHTAQSRSADTFNGYKLPVAKR